MKSQEIIKEVQKEANLRNLDEDGKLYNKIIPTTKCNGILQFYRTWDDTPCGIMEYKTRKISNKIIVNFYRHI